MELHFTEMDKSNSDKKRVSFTYESSDDENVEDLGYADIISTPAINSTPVTNTKSNYNPDLPNVGRFQTVQRQKPATAPASSGRVNVPLDSSVLTQKAPPQPIKRKQISYDDILNSMNMRVGADGKLQMYSQKLQDEHMLQQQQLQRQPFQQQQQNRQGFQRQPFQQQQPAFQQQQQVEPQPPLTKRQYKQLLVLDLIRRQQEQQRLSQVKSTKLLFPNPNVRIGTRQPVNLNKLFRLK